MALSWSHALCFPNPTSSSSIHCSQMTKRCARCASRKAWRTFSSLSINEDQEDSDCRRRTTPAHADPAVPGGARRRGGRTLHGEQALETIRLEKPNLVFLDVMMPKKNGFDVCNAVKNEMGLSHIHVILLTAKGQEFDRQRGLEVGANLYMTKPFDPDALVAEARSVLGLPKP